MVAAVRCVLMYVVFPFVLPALGIAKWRRSGDRPRGQHRGDGVHRDEHAPLLPCRSPQAVVVRGLGGTVFVLLVYVAVVDFVDLLT